ncbi:YlmH/Sll1252 family protein, partial [uncultured Gemmiger sp.]|uniref:YlmH/Sll1252 family protein n=1 Tax=uncultured Gemmiger sp. TaxID=1623490 RepID=UPI0025E72F4C
LCIEPPDAWQEEPLAYLQFTAYGDKLPTHRDYLGSILGLGLERTCVGDLLADPARADTFYAVVLADKQAFIASELTSAGHSTVHTDCLDALPPQLAAGPERSLQEATVPSLRADAVLAVMLHTSRTRAAEYIAAGRVEINHLPLKAAHETAYAEDIFTVRGVGRFKLVAIGGKSRKDRLFISFYQY